MAYDKELHLRVKLQLAEQPEATDKKMFGGVCYLVRGNMACGIVGEELIVRVGPEGHADALAQPHARPFDYTGRPMNGWVMVAKEGIAGEEELAAWLERGLTFVRTLPAKGEGESGTVKRGKKSK